MTADQRYADTLLSYWAKWVKTSTYGGYPRSTIESRLMEEGVLIPTIGKLESSDDLAEAIECIVIKLPHNTKKLLKIEYLTYDTRKNKQKRLHLSRYKYEQILHSALNRVSEEFDLQNNQQSTTLKSVGL